MKKVLIITYYWPPASGPGVQRYLKFSKYLPEFGWKPYIVTVKNGTYSSTDPTLNNDIHPEVSVTKTKTNEPFAIYNKLTGKEKKAATVGLLNLNNNKSLIEKLSIYARANFFIPDARKGWNRFAYKASKKLIQQENIKIVITTGPPHSTHLVGQKLKTNLGVKWLADFRDPWTNIFYNEALPRTKLTIKKDQKLENKVLTMADRVVVISNGLKEEFENRRVSDIIYNGFDNDDLSYQPWEDKNMKFTISHTGNLMPTQNISTIWKALKELTDENKEFLNQVRISFTGNVDIGILEDLRKFGLNQLVDNHGYVSHTEATKAMITSDLLLFIIPQTKHNKLIITGKLFEYIASRTPILAIGPTDGDASQILKNTGHSQMIDFQNKKLIKTYIQQSFNQWSQSKKPIRCNTKNIEQFSRKTLTAKLANTLNELIKI